MLSEVSQRPTSAVGTDCWSAQSSCGAAGSPLAVQLSQTLHLTSLGGLISPRALTHCWPQQNLLHLISDPHRRIFVKERQNLTRLLSCPFVFYYFMKYVHFLQIAFALFLSSRGRYGGSNTRWDAHSVHKMLTASPPLCPSELTLPQAFSLHYLILQLPHSTAYRSPSQVKYYYHIDFCLPAFYRDVLGRLQSLLQHGSSIALSIILSPFCSGLNCSCFSLLSTSTNGNFLLHPETQPLCDTDE